MQPNLQATLLPLINEALAEFGQPSYTLSSVIRKAIRITSLNKDYVNLTWLRLQMSGSKEEQNKIWEDLRLECGDTLADLVRNIVVEEYLRIRTTEEKKVLIESIPDTEHKLRGFSQTLSDISTGHPANSVQRTKDQIFLQNAIYERTMFLNKIGQQVHDILVTAERNLWYGAIQSDIFARTRQYVDVRLSQLAPQALQQFVSVYRRMSEGDTEARSQAVTSCRRILKTVADALYPPRDETIPGPKGQPIALNDANYRARLRKYVLDNAKHETSRDLLVAQLNDLGERIARLDNLASKGVHADISTAEVDQCVIQTYLAIGDVLRLTDPVTL
jgi:hypothetical protein